MRALLQRVSKASVRVDGDVVGQIGTGLLVFFGAGKADDDDDLNYIVRKTAELRIFEDESGKMNLSVEDIGGALLVVSQFTLYGNTRKGRRPSFVDAMHPAEAEPMYDRACKAFVARGLEVQKGAFGEHMEVELVNDGPVTIWLDSKERNG